MSEGSKTVRLAAVTSTLDWSLRQTCSNERFDMKVAQRYVREHTDQNIERMAQAAGKGADLVLSPEYFRGSEMFTTSKENQLPLVEPTDGPTFRALSEVARSQGVYLSACYNAAHDGAIAQTAVLVVREGELIGTHVKHNSIPPDSHLQKRLDLFDLDIGSTGVLICADVTDNPEYPLMMAKRGLQILLVPGVGFAGEHWKHFIIVRAIDLKCVVVYADATRGLIVNSKGDILAETTQPDDIIVADVEI